MENTTKMTIIAEALADNREYKNARIDGKTVGVASYRAWTNAVKALRHSAYAVAQFQHANLGNSEVAEPCDMSKIYENLRAVLDLVGVVNGAKLQAQNIAESIIANASRIRVIDITPEMAHAHSVKREARKAMTEDDTPENTKAYEEACVEVERLESIAGNCKRHAHINCSTICLILRIIIVIISKFWLFNCFRFWII